MEYAALLLSLAAVDFAAAATPGANFVLVVETALGRTRRHALAVVAGFVVSNMVWCAAVIGGLAALFALSPVLYAGLRIAGGTYLIYLGLTLWLGRGGGAEGRATVGRSLTQSFARGVLTNLANPKSVIYFGSIFATFFRQGTPSFVHALAVSIVLMNTFVWYGTVALTFSSQAVRQRYATFRRAIDRTAGTLMLAFGARLITERE